MHFPKALGLIAGGSFGAAVGLIPAIFTFGALGSNILPGNYTTSNAVLGTGRLIPFYLQRILGKNLAATSTKGW